MSRTTLPVTRRASLAGPRGARRGACLRWLREARGRLCVGSLGLALLAVGCTFPKEFVRNGFKVGPNYHRPPAPLAPTWIDADNPRVNSFLGDYSAWWRVFDDPVLDDLVRTAYAQNVNLRVAGTRVLEARAQRAITVGALFPQTQQATGEFEHVATSGNVANPLLHHFFDNWATGLNASWEIDFWGRFRRNVEATTDLVESSVDDYDFAMVTLLGDLATAYVQYRLVQQQIAYTRENIAAQKEQVKVSESRWKGGLVNERSVVQAKSLLDQNESLIPFFEIQLRQANNRLCVLLGIPPIELAAKLGEAAIPAAPAEVVVGIPADLVRRRPDVRSAERQIAAQNAQIGVAEADLYPALFINGNIGLAAKDFARLFDAKSLTGQIGPAFQWNILNYGRILNNVRLQDFKTQELVGTYQQKVLTAAEEAENGMVTFLRSRQQAQYLADSVKEARRALELAIADFRGGTIDYTPVFVAQQFLTQLQNDLSFAQGNIALGLISTYRALGGGWELRLHLGPGPEAEAEQAAPSGSPEPAVLPPPRELSGSGPGSGQVAASSSGDSGRTAGALLVGALPPVEVPPRQRQFATPTPGSKEGVP
jgi:NodT family efflux transporter outer membrane factor (OMF) lipoprotein